MAAPSAGAGASATASGDKATERTPLLEDLEKARKAAPPTADESKLFQLSRFVNANRPWYMFLVNIGMCILNVSTVIGAYFYVLASVHKTPKCYEYNDYTETMIFCNVCSFCFWTFPLVCTLVVVLLFAKNMFDTRLYYESMLHKCLLDYRNAALTESPVLWLLLVYGILALLTFIFVVADHVDAGDKAANFAGEVFGALAYFAPVLSFGIVFSSYWQIESQLIPLPKFCETDPTFASALLAEGTYVPEAEFRLAFENVEEKLEKKDKEAMSAGLPEWPPMASHEYFGMLLLAAKEELKASAETVDKDPPLPLAWYEQCLADRGYAPVEDYQTLRYGLETATQRRPDEFSSSYSIRKGGYWAYRLLFSPHLYDDRVKDFRWWCRAYLLFVAVSLAFFIYTFTTTTITFLTYQRIIAHDCEICSWFRWFSGEHLMDGEQMVTAVTSPESSMWGRKIAAAQQELAGAAAHHLATKAQQLAAAAHQLTTWGDVHH